MLEDTIKQLKELRSQSRNQRIHNKDLIDALNSDLLDELKESDEKHLKDWVLVKQYHAWGETVAIYTKESWNKKEQATMEYEQRNLKWIN